MFCQKLFRAALPALLATASVAAVPAQAVTLLEQTGSTGMLDLPSSLLFTFDAGVGAGLARFTINGYNSLDGNNGFADTLKVSLNGTTILSGRYDLGGGGGNRTDFAPLGAVIQSTSFGAWKGGRADFEIPLELVTGLNTLSIGYEGGRQGLRDEGWGVSNLRVSGLANAVPEPATWFLMITGFGMVGYLARRKRFVQTLA